MPVVLEKIVEEIKALTPEQRQILRDMLDTLPQSNETPEEEMRQREDELLRRLHEKGILAKIPLPITDPRPFDDWKPIEIKGKPLSETIIEERR